MAKAAKAQGARAQKAYQLLPVVGPSAGVDLRTSPTLLAPDQARTLVNFSLTEPGALTTRPGYARFSTASLGSGRPQGGKRVYLNTAIPAAASTIFTLLAYNGGVYNQTDSGGWASTTASLSGLSTREIDFPADRDLVAALDGQSTAHFKSTNGSSWTRFGIAPPDVGSTLSTLSTGGLSSGGYELAFTYKDRDLAHESNASSTNTITLTASSGAISVQAKNSTDAQVDAIVVYARKTTAGETVLRKASSQAMGAGTSSTIVITSTNWTTNDELPTDHNLPPSLAFGVVWKNRWWARSATVTNRIHFTQLFQPQSWPALFYVDIPFERGDEVTALVPLGDTLLVFGNTKIFVILGTTSLDFEVRPSIASEDGAFGFRSVAVLENGVVHAGAAGIYIFDGASDKLLSHQLEPAWRDLVRNVAVSELSKIALVYHQATKELRVSVPRRYPSGTFGEWVLDLNQTRSGQKPAWAATDRTIGGYILWDGPETQSGDRGRLFSWHSSQALLFQEATGTTANSSNLTAQYEGPGLTLGTHRARWVDVRGEYEPHAGALSIEPTVDDVSMGTQSIVMGSQGPICGSAICGSATLGGSARRQFYRMLPLRAEPIPAKRRSSCIRITWAWFRKRNRGPLRSNRGQLSHIGQNVLGPCQRTDDRSVVVQRSAG
jgi:hypothetical protein